MSQVAPAATAGALLLRAGGTDPRIQATDYAVKRSLFDPWGLTSLLAFTLAATLMAVYGFIAFGTGMTGFLQLP